MWKLDEEVTTEEIEKSVQDLKQIYDVVGYTYYINPLNLKSIPEVGPPHVLSYPRLFAQKKRWSLLGFFWENDWLRALGISRRNGVLF